MLKNIITLRSFLRYLQFDDNNSSYFDGSVIRKSSTSKWLSPQTNCKWSFRFISHSAWQRQFFKCREKNERHRHNFEIEIIHLVKNEGSLRHVWKCRRERDAWIVLILFGFETIFCHSRARDLSHLPIATLSVCPWLCYGCLLRLGINWLLPLVAFVVTYRGWIMFRKNEHQQMNTHTQHTISTIEIAHHRKKRKRKNVLLFDATSLIDCHSM